MSKTTIVDRYGVAPNELLNRSDLSLKAKGLFVFIQSKPDGWSFSIAKMMTQLKEGKESLQKAIKELEDCGYLSRKPIKNESGQYSGYDYELHAKPATGKHVRRETQSPLERKREVKSNFISKEIKITSATHKNYNETTTANEESSINPDSVVESSPQLSSESVDMSPVPEEFDLNVYVSEKLLCPEATVANKIIGLFISRKKQEYNLPDLRTKKQVEYLMPRWHKAVKPLVDGGYARDQISEAIDRALYNVKEETAIETIIKYIAK